MGLIKACVMKVAEATPRVSVVIKIDHRPGVASALQNKVEAVEGHYGTPRVVRDGGEGQPTDNPIGAVCEAQRSAIFSPASGRCP